MATAAVMMADPPLALARSISIVIPCRNESRHIDLCLASITSQEDLPRDAEIIVADGISTDDTRERILRWCARDPRIVLVDNPHRTVSHGLNAAIRRSTGAIILRMDVHTEYAPDYVKMCVATLVATGADNVGGPARTRARGAVQEANSMAYHSAFSVGGARFHDVEYEGPVDTVVYGCWRRELFSRIGLFDTELARNQDDELNLRIIRAGGQLWQDPKIRSWYYPRSTLRSVFMQYFQYGYWKVRVIQKHRVPASMRHLVPGVFVTCVGVVGFMAPFSSLSTVTLAFLVSGYAIASVTASVWACSRAGRFRNLPVLPAVFACYHLGYGLGFLRGVWDFVIRRRASVSFDNLTR